MKDGHDQSGYCDEPKIHEYNRGVPIWLIIVYLLITLWGIYYLAAFWTGE